MPAGRYMIKGNNTLKLKSNVNLKGVKDETIIDFSQREAYSIVHDDNGNLIEANYLIGAMGNINKDCKAGLKKDANKDDKSIELDTKLNLSKNDLILITSNREWYEGPEEKKLFPLQIGELLTVETNNEESVLLSNSVSDNYLKSDMATIYKIDPVENITVDGITFIGKGRTNKVDKISKNGTVTYVMRSSDYGLGFTYCRNIIVKNCTFKHIDTKQLEFRSCYNFTVDGCYFEHDKYTAINSKGEAEVVSENKTPEGYTDGKVQYQVRAADACKFGTITNCIGVRGRHFFNTGHSDYLIDGSNALSKGTLFGLNRFINVCNCKSSDTWHAGYSTHNDAEYLTFDNCWSDGSDVAGFNPRSSYNKVKNCVVVNSHCGILLSKNIRNCIIENNKIFNSTGAILLDVYDAPSTSEKNFENMDFENIDINNNIIEKCDKGIIIKSSSEREQSGVININNNTIVESGKSGLDAGIRTIFEKGNYEIKENKIIKSPNAGMYLQSLNNCLLECNLIDSCKIPISIKSVKKIEVFNNIIIKDESEKNEWDILNKIEGAINQGNITVNYKNQN